jgi:hypothetical protein
MTQIIQKRVLVNQAYTAHGFHSTQYQRSFDELHGMNMLFMADRFRQERGLSPKARTPYC